MSSTKIFEYYMFDDFGKGNTNYGRRGKCWGIVRIKGRGRESLYKLHI